MVRQLAKSSGGLTKPLTKGGLMSRLRGKHHFHFCSDRECRLLYEDACEKPEKNDKCQLCRGAANRTVIAPRDPQDCCLNNCEQVLEVNEMLRYKLAGTGPWYQCKNCARCHGWSCVI